MVYDFDSQESDTQALEEGHEVEALEERLTSLAVRMRERKGLLNSILSSARAILPRPSFLRRIARSHALPAPIAPPSSFVSGASLAHAAPADIAAINQTASEMLVALETAVTAFSEMEQMSQKRSLAGKTPCSTQAECDELASKAGACSARRVTLLQTYDTMNIGVPVVSISGAGGNLLAVCVT